jgi:hypothetical protein
MAELIASRYSKQGLWSLFLMCAFPLHVWALLLSLRDVSWLIERTNLWDAVSVVSYGLVFAFVESVVIFLVFVLLGFLVSPAWDKEKRIALLCVLMLVASVWAMLGQLFFLWGVSVPDQVMAFLHQTAHPLRVLYFSALVLVTPTVVLPAFFILRSNRSLPLTRALIERISLLTMFYLLFDIAGLVVVVIRNVN